MTQVYPGRHCSPGNPASDLSRRCRTHGAVRPDQHRQFFSQLPFLIVGSVDDSGLPWASLLAGQSGFATTPDEHVATRLPKGDPLHVALRPDAMLGILGIELATRRRNRINGRVVASTILGSLSRSTKASVTARNIFSAARRSRKCHRPEAKSSHLQSWVR